MHTTYVSHSRREWTSQSQPAMSQNQASSLSNRQYLCAVAGVISDACSQRRLMIAVSKAAYATLLQKMSSTDIVLFIMSISHLFVLFPPALCLSVPDPAPFQLRSCATAWLLSLRFPCERGIRPVNRQISSRMFSRHPSTQYEYL